MPVLFQVYESSGGAAGEQLSRRCVALLHTGLRADLWPNADLHLLWLDKLLQTVEPSQQVHIWRCWVRSPVRSCVCDARAMEQFIVITSDSNQCVDEKGKGVNQLRRSSRHLGM